MTPLCLGPWTHWPAVQRGDALEISVSRDVNWLQPTFVMPQIHYAGNVDHGVRRLIERDLEATLEYSATELGVQADPFSLVVVVAGDAKSAHDKTTELGHPWEWESFRNFWQRAGGWYSSDQDAFYLKSSTWEVIQQRALPLWSLRGPARVHSCVAVPADGRQRH